MLAASVIVIIIIIVIHFNSGNKAHKSTEQKIKEHNTQHKKTEKNTNTDKLNSRLRTVTTLYAQTTDASASLYGYYSCSIGVNKTLQHLPSLCQSYRQA